MLMILVFQIASLLLTSHPEFSLLCDAFVNKPHTTTTTTTRRCVFQKTNTFASIGSDSTRFETMLLFSSPNNEEKKEGGRLPALLDPGTKGGVLVLGTLLFIIPFLFYNFITSAEILSEEDAGRFIGVGFTVVTSLLWVSTYIFRVATKDMTYAKQLKDYENAVIKKRLEELEEDEVQAMLEDIDREQREEQEAF
mmetsp:Transcript_3585/g.5324  ORF Transcript_3585/g.5324 Transcript_3585/m.5324 type:complete len:195 (+) Transcript_3585:106-690(+)